MSVLVFGRMGMLVYAPASEGAFEQPATTTSTDEMGTSRQARETTSQNLRCYAMNSNLTWSTARGALAPPRRFTMTGIESEPRPALYTSRSRQAGSTAYASNIVSGSNVQLMPLKRGVVFVVCVERRRERMLGESGAQKKLTEYSSRAAQIVKRDICNIYSQCDCDSLHRFWSLSALSAHTKDPNRHACGC
jgi:hypothetical protein